jgi:hypothetical protein
VKAEAGNYVRNVALLGASLGMLGFVVAAEESSRFTDKPSVQ